MQANLAKALGFIFVSEGGFALRDTEPGGAVNMGVSMKTYALWSTPKAVTIADLRAMTVDEATAIYTAIYAGQIDFSQLPIGLDYCVLDAAVNEGIAAALLFLSVALSYNPIGIAAPVYADLLANVSSISLSQLRTKLLQMIAAGAALPTLINSICDNRLAEKRKRPQWPQFGLGWTNRVEYVRANSLGMIGT